MNKHLFIATLVVFGIYGSLAHAQVREEESDRDQQIGIKIGASVPNGAEAGADYQFSEHFRVGGGYGYLHYADAANLQVQGGFKHFYAFAGVDMINANGIGRAAISSGINQQISSAGNNDPMVKAGFSGIQFKESDFKMTDYGFGGGLGMKFGWFYLEAGLRTTQLRQIANDKVDMFVNTVENYVNQNTNLLPAERQAAIQKVESMRSDIKSQLLQQYNTVPGNLNFLPVLRIGVRIPLRF